jgi:glutathione synthase
MYILLIKVLRRLVEIDDFMAGLWKVHLAVKSEGYAQV